MNLFPGQLEGLQPKDLATLTNGLCGLSAVFLAAFGSPFAPAGVFAGAFFDWLDGKLARAGKGKAKSNAFGKQLDSLADAVTFGVAPAFLAVAAVAYLDGYPLVLSLAAGLFYLSAILVRLARFNLSDGKSFTGLPSPAAAMLVTLVVVLAPSFAPWALLISGWLAAGVFRMPKML